MIYFYWSIIVHKFWVWWYTTKVCWVLTKRCFFHDLSKFSTKEAKIFSKTFPNLRYSRYGEKSYDDLLRSVEPAVEHHYLHNSHHPEHYSDGIKSMTLLDQLEMVCDWAASIKKHNKASLSESLDVNAERFGYSMQYKNNLRRLIEEAQL